MYTRFYFYVKHNNPKMHKPKNKNALLYLQLYVVREMITSSRFKIIFQSYIIIIYIYVCTYVCIYKYI